MSAMAQLDWATARAVAQTSLRRGGAEPAGKDTAAPFGRECLAVGLAMILVLSPGVEALTVPSRPGATLHQAALPLSPGRTAQVKPSGFEQADAASPARLKEAVKKLPLYFVENRGQADPQVAYYVQGGDTSVYFTRAGITFALSGPAKTEAGAATAPSEEAGFHPAAAARERWAVKLDFVGANPDARPAGEDRTEAVVSYFKGDRADWKTGLSTYGRVVYPNLWPGIDLVYTGAGGRLKYTFVVRPGGDPKRIRLAYRGATAVGVSQEGRLAVSTPVGPLEEDTPYVYQETGEERVEVEAAYALEAEEAGDTHRFGFRVGSYDLSKPLFLDPVILNYCGFIGGSGTDLGKAIAVDSSGNAYVAGETDSPTASFPVTAGAWDVIKDVGTDVFVAKVNAAGTALIYCGYIGGSGNDQVRDLAVDSLGNAYVTGQTTSTQAAGFPVIGGPDVTYNGGARDAFVAKVNAAGTALVYCGYIGGSGDDLGHGIAVDSSFNAYVMGDGTSANMPVTGGAWDVTYAGTGDAWLAKVSVAGTAPLIYCGYIGGTAEESGWGVAVDSLGNAYVAGETASTFAQGFPVVGPLDGTYNGGAFDVFVAKVNPAGTALIYSGYIGGAGDDSAFGLAIDGSGNAYVTGLTTSADFPAILGPDLTYNLAQDAFVAKVNAAGSALIYSGYIGGSGADQGRRVAVDSSGFAYVAGDTASDEATFPVTQGPDLTYNLGALDAFVAKVNPAGTGLVYCGYIGGSGTDQATAIAVDGSGNAYVVGDSTSAAATFPETVGPDLIDNGGIDAWVAKIQETSTNYRSIGTAAAYGTGTISVTNRSQTVTGAGGAAWQTANRGRGDAITIPCPDPPTCTGGTHYTVFWVGAETNLLLTQGYVGATASGLTYLIRRQFTTLAAWEDCIDGGGSSCGLFPVVPSSSLVADDRKEVGIAYNDSVFTLASSVVIDGSTTDTAHTITLTVDPGNRHNGSPGAGVRVNANGGPNEIQILDDNVTLEWFEIYGLRGGGSFLALVRVIGPAANNVLLQNLLLHDFFDAIVGNNNDGIRLSGSAGKSVTVRNTMIWDGDAFGIAGDELTDTLTIENCSIDWIHDSGNRGIYTQLSAVTVRNTIVTSSGTDFATAGGSFTGSNNTSSDTTAATFFTNPQQAAASALFVSSDVAAANLHLKVGANPAVDTGLDLSSSFVLDVDGQQRPAGAAWDRGADEFGATTAVTLLSFSASPADTAVDLSWVTASEFQNLGFHLYRSLSVEGPWERITSSLIPGLGSSPTGASYSYRDAGLTNGTTYYYLLEDVETTGRTERHGPVSATPQAGSGGGGSGDGGSGEDGGSGGDTSGSGRITYGDPSAASLRVVERGPTHVVLELLTPGFTASTGADGTVRISIPGFEDTATPGALAVPVRHALVEALAGRRVLLTSVTPDDVVAFDSFHLKAAGTREVEVTDEGVVKAASSPRRLLAANRRGGFAPRLWARLLGALFQGETKKARLELSPLRHDPVSGRTVLARRLLVRLDFTGIEPGEKSLGGLSRPTPASSPPACQGGRGSARDPRGFSLPRPLRRRLRLGSSWRQCP